MTEIPERFNLAAALVDAHLPARESRPAIRYVEARGIGGGEADAGTRARTGSRSEPEGLTLSYGDVARLVNRFGNALRELGVEAEDRVALLVLDSPEFVASFFGSIKIGAVPIPLSTLLKPGDYRYLLADSRAKVAVVSEPLLRNLEEIQQELRHLKHVVVTPHPNADAARDAGNPDGERAASALEPGGGGTRPGYLNFAELCQAASAELDPEPTSKDDMCFWLYSSGTTGQPKAVVHLQHDNWLTAELYGRQVIGITEADRVFSVAKLFFSYGLGNALTIPFRFGATTILYPGRPEPRVVYELVARERPTLFFSVPTSYAALLNEPGTHDLSSVRLCISAGEALPKTLYERWLERFGIEILDGIGSTEAGYIFISNFPGRARPGTSGQVIAGYEVKILDEHERAVPVGEVGDLWVKGDSAAAFYWNKHDKTKRAFRGEWLVTGDRYSVDADGYYTYAGRSDDMLKVGGMWVSPIEVEAALIEHPAVLECAVVGRADADQLVKPAAFVVLKDGAAASADELRAFVRDRLAYFKCPRWVEFLPELPKTATGKIQRYKLRQPDAATGEGLRPAGAAPS